jgi:hypothetical protein
LKTENGYYAAVVNGGQGTVQTGKTGIYAGKTENGYSAVVNGGPSVVNSGANGRNPKYMREK